MAIDPNFHNDQKTLIMPILPTEDTVTTLDTPEPPIAENSPAVTLPQKIAAIVAGIPILCNLTGAFGIWAPNEAQVDALEKSGAYAVVLAGVLVIGDAGVRIGRNVRVGAQAGAAAQVAVAETHANVIAAETAVRASRDAERSAPPTEILTPEDPGYVPTDAEESEIDIDTHEDLSDLDTPEKPDASA